jgi:DNA-binding helix-hairpin-helix protein with protein kinase domain
MTSEPLFLRGRQFTPGDRIGRGGEGAVYAVTESPQLAVKVYYHPDAQREAKIGAIVQAQLGKRCREVAFPLDIVHHANGRFAGFIMSRATDRHPIHEVIANGSRRQFFPDADWRFLVRVALNVARTVANAHGAGVVIGDINSAGFLVSPQALVTLIDADSFQIGSHRCRVGMPEYTPPELQGVRFTEIDRTTDHDGFGLAVLVFQVLALGRHPYAGILQGRPLPIEAAIIRGKFAYSLVREIGVVPPAGTLHLSDLPAGVRLLFELAFVGRGRSRPTAAEWVHELSQLEDGLVPCPNQPHHHIATLALPCPWCRIEKATGQALFPAATTTSCAHRTDTALGRDVASAIRRVMPSITEKIRPPWPKEPIQPSKAAIDAPSVSARERAQLAQGMWPKPGTSRTYRPLIDRFVEAMTDATRALTQWRTDIGLWDARAAVELLQLDLAEYHRAIASLPFLLAQAEARCTAYITKRTMVTRSISDVRLPGIGTALTGQLARQGIRNAADIDRVALSAISGLGETRIVTLLLWRDEVAVDVEREPRSAAEIAKALTLAKQQIDTKFCDAENAIRQGIARLEANAISVQRRATVIDHGVSDALRTYEQCAIDLDHVGIDRSAAMSLYSLSSTPSQATPHQSGSTPKKSKAGLKKGKDKKTCPQCGGPMVKRWATNIGKNGMYLGCSAYPKCTGTR